MTNYESLLSQIEKKVDKLPVGTEFALKSLFDKKEWDKIPAEDRRTLGRKYRLKCDKDKGDILNVEYSDKDTSSHAHIYIKVR